MREPHHIAAVPVAKDARIDDIVAWRAGPGGEQIMRFKARASPQAQRSVVGRYRGIAPTITAWQTHRAGATAREFCECAHSSPGTLIATPRCAMKRRTNST